MIMEFNEGEAVQIGDSLVVVKRAGRVVRLAIKARKSTLIRRQP